MKGGLVTGKTRHTVRHEAAVGDVGSTLRRPDVPTGVGRGSAEQIRRGEVSRTLKKMDLSPEGEEAVERLSHSLTGELLRGPISEVMKRAGIEFSPFGGRGPGRAPGL